MVGHHHPGVEVASLPLEVPEGALNDLGEIRSFQDHGAAIDRRFGVLSEAIRTVVFNVESSTPLRL
jgi:hypothetical protein